MGQTSFELATAIADGPSCCSNDTLELRSWGSVEFCEVETCELKDTELSEGETRLVLVVFLLCCEAATAGERDLPFPRIRPPPSDRLEVMFARTKFAAHLLKRHTALNRSGVVGGAFGRVEIGAEREKKRAEILQRLMMS